MNTCDRDAGSEIMTLCYFKSHEDLQAFAHSEHHRKVWDWWNGLMKEKMAEHISIAHEVYAAPKGAWEGVYINHVPSMFGKYLYAAAHVHSGLTSVINNFLVHILRLSFECGRHLLTSYSFTAATHHWVKDEEGQGSWQSPLVPGKGRYKSALGRMGKSRGMTMRRMGRNHIT